MFISRGLILIDFGNMFFLNLQAFGSCSTSASAPPSPDSDLGRGTKSLAQMSRSLTYLEHCCAHQSESFCVPQLKHICCKSYIYGVDFGIYQPFLLHQTTTWISMPTAFDSFLCHPVSPSLGWNRTRCHLERLCFGRVPYLFPRVARYVPGLGTYPWIS